jgi:3-hydroxyisobutyrate dehydrogenase-like beta-hydroxyacid dehydrogenase
MVRPRARFAAASTNQPTAMTVSNVRLVRLVTHAIVGGRRLGPDSLAGMSVRVGVVGLGIMGSGMASNLLAAGHQVSVQNRTAARTEPFAAAGATVWRTPAELAGAVDVVLVCVSDTPDVEAVLFGPDGVAAGAATGSLVIDASTISPDATRTFAAKLAAQGVGFVDAPVSGGSEGAVKGTLSIMVGGSEEDLDRARPVLAAIGKTITHVGPVGAGQTCKLVNQILVVVNMLAVSEALLLAQAGGLDLGKTIAAVESGAAASWMLSNRGPQVVARDWRPGFTIDLQQKDLRLVLEAADSLGVPLLGTATVYQLYRTLQAGGLGGEGNHALAKALEALSGVTVGQTGDNSDDAA